MKITWKWVAITNLAAGIWWIFVSPYGDFMRDFFIVVSFLFVGYSLGRMTQQ